MINFYIINNYISYMSANTITCNLNCICINSDCIYKHHIQYKERKIVKRFYDSISKKTIEEPNNETRKKNCTFGQLCENKNCGFRHRLSYGDREKLIISYKFNKICPSIQPITTKEIVSSPSKSININSFMILDSDDIIENDVNVNANVNVNVKQSTSGKSWVDVVKKDITKSYLSDEEEFEKDFEDFEDDGFYMKF